MLRAYRKNTYSPNAQTIKKKREEYAAVYRFLCGEDSAPFPD
jgi:hypothetical protein